MLESLQRANKLLFYAMLASVPMALFGQWGLLLNAAAFIIAAIVGAKAENRYSLEGLRLTWPGWSSMLWGAVLAVVFFPLSIFLNGVFMKWVFPNAYLMNSAMDTNQFSGLRLLGVILMVPIAEEVFMRGYLLRTYEQRGVRWAVVASSVVFAVIHANPTAVGSYFVGAFAMAYLAISTGSILPSIAMHATHNAFPTLLRMYSQPTGDVTLSIPLITIAFYLVLSVPALFLMHSWWKRLTPDTLPEPESVPEDAEKPPTRRVFAHWPLAVFYAFNILIAMMLWFAPASFWSNMG